MTRDFPVVNCGLTNKNFWVEPSDIRGKPIAFNQETRLCPRDVRCTGDVFWIVLGCHGDYIIRQPFGCIYLANGRWTIILSPNLPEGSQTWQWGIRYK